MHKTLIYKVFKSCRGNGIRTHDPLLPKQFTFVCNLLKIRLIKLTNLVSQRFLKDLTKSLSILMPIFDFIKVQLHCVFYHFFTTTKPCIIYIFIFFNLVFWKLYIEVSYVV